MYGLIICFKGQNEDIFMAKPENVNSILLSAGYISFFPFGALSLTI